jgi:hypothetical protein
MKRILLSTAILISISSVAAAQTSGGNSGNSPSVSSSTAGPKKGKGTKGKKAASDTLNNRKMYQWKDGQRATPTGHEATGTGSGNAALGRDTTTRKDSAMAPRDSTKQQ